MGAQAGHRKEQLTQALIVRLFKKHLLSLFQELTLASPGRPPISVKRVMNLKWTDHVIVGRPGCKGRRLWWPLTAVQFQWKGRNVAIPSYALNREPAPIPEIHQ